MKRNLVPILSLSCLMLSPVLNAVEASNDDSPSATADSDPREIEESLIERNLPHQLKQLWPAFFTLFPETTVFPPHKADLNRPQFAIGYMYEDSPEIPSVGKNRLWSSVGATVPIALWETRQQRAFEIYIEAGVVTELDIDARRDVVGWDGIYGLGASTSLNESVSLRFGYHHQSGHIGDEYLETEPMVRENYYRDEWYLGSAFNAGPLSRVYAEVYYLMRGGARKQEDFRFQWGLEYNCLAPWEDASWVVATNIRHLQEKDWEPSITVQAGVEIDRPNSSRNYRIAATYYRGDSLMMEFLDHQEEFAMLGLFVDY